eukprot:1190349-Prorocentrum_minimum.AAC.3
METDMWHSKACFAVRTPGWVFTTLATRVLDVYAPHVLRILRLTRLTTLDRYFPPLVQANKDRFASGNSRVWSPESMQAWLALPENSAHNRVTKHLLPWVPGHHLGGAAAPDLAGGRRKCVGHDFTRYRCEFTLWTCSFTRCRCEFTLWSCYFTRSRCEFTRCAPRDPSCSITWGNSLTTEAEYSGSGAVWALRYGRRAAAVPVFQKQLENNIWQELQAKQFLEEEVKGSSSNTDKATTTPA